MLSEINEIVISSLGPLDSYSIAQSAGCIGGIIFCHLLEQKSIKGSWGQET